MAEALQDWLVKTMGYMANVREVDYGDLLYDGTVFHEILVKHNVIDVKKFPPPPRRSKIEVAKHSLANLGVWFKLLGINHSRDVLDAAANKDSRACLRMLFELFAKLQTKENFHFLMKQKAEEIQHTPSGKFVVKRATEPTKPLEQRPSYFHLEDLLRTKKDVVTTYKQLKAETNNWCTREMQKRREAVKKWGEQQTYISNKFDHKSDKNPGDPIDDFNRSLHEPKRNEDILNAPNDKYVGYLRQKRKKMMTNNVLRMKMQDTLMRDLWTEISDNRDKELTEKFKKILLQRCHYEEALSNTLQKLHDNYMNFSDFTNYINDLTENEFTLAENVYQSKKEEYKQDARTMEMNRVLELHQRLWDEKHRIKRENHEKFCLKIVNDMINHALKYAEFKQDFKCEPPSKILDEWKILFFKDLPVLREQIDLIDDFYKDEIVEKPDNLNQMTSGTTFLQNKIDHENEMHGTAHHTQQAALPLLGAIKHPSSDLMVLMQSHDLTEYQTSCARLPIMTELQTQLPSIALKDVKKKCEEDFDFIIDREVVECINNFNLRSYLNTTGTWNLGQWPEIWPEQQFDEKMNILGNDVHRLLDLKYPMPKGPKPPTLAQFKIKAILGKFREPEAKYITKQMRNLLDKENIEVIHIFEPVNYCLNAYRSELHITEFASVLKTKKSRKELNGAIEHQYEVEIHRRWERRQSKHPEKPPNKPLTNSIPPIFSSMSRGGKKSITSSASGSRKSVARKSKAGSSRKSMARKSRGSRKSMARKSKAGSSRKSMARKSRGSRISVARKSKMGGAKKSIARKSKVGGSRKSVSGKQKSKAGDMRKSASSVKVQGSAGRSCQSGFNKATQFPSLPDLRRQYKHSPAGKLGKLAFETLSEGRKLNDALLGNMLIEYLKTMDDRRGFVLVNFPLSALQANIFEHQFTGFPVDYSLECTSEVDLFKTNDVSADEKAHVRIFLDYENMLLDYVREVEPPTDPQEFYETVYEKKSNESKDGSKTPKKSMARKSVTKRKSAAGRKSQVSRQSKVARKIASARKSQSPMKSKTTIKPPTGAAKQNSVNGEHMAKNNQEVITAQHKVETRPDEKVQFQSPLPPPEPSKPPLSLDKLTKLRISEILPRPNKDLLHGTSSYFTKYIHPMQMQANKQELLELARIKKGPFDHDPAKLLQHEENKVYSFYKNLGIITDFDYMRLDTETVQRLARVILGEVWDIDDATRKPSIELFGVNNVERIGRGSSRSSSSGSSQGSRTSFLRKKVQVKSQKLEGDLKIIYRKYQPIKLLSPPPQSPVQEQPAIEEATTPEEGTEPRRKSKGSKESVSSKSIFRKSMSRKSIARKSIKRKSKAQKESIEGRKSKLKRQSKVSKKSTSRGRPKVDQTGSKQNTEEISIQPQPKSKPGEQGWVYVNEPIPYKTGYTAATLWECAENVYVENMEKIFYLLRMHDMKVLPYKEYVLSHLAEGREEENRKGQLVTNFQLMLNKVDNDYRHDVDMKKELYVRANELYDLVSGFALGKGERSLKKKEEIIAQGWVANHVYTLANLYLTMMQLEMDLYVDALQVLNDYYMSMLGEVPQKHKPSKTLLVKNKMITQGNIALNRQSTTGGRRRRRTISKTSLPQVTLRHSLVTPWQIEQALLKSTEATSSRGSPLSDTNPMYPLLTQADGLKEKIRELEQHYQGVIKNPEVGELLRKKKFRENMEGVAAMTPKPHSAASAKGGAPKRQSMARRKSKRKSTVKVGRKSLGQRQSKRKSTIKRQSTAANVKSSIKRQSNAGALKRSSTKGKSRNVTIEEALNTIEVTKEEWEAAVAYQARRTEFRLKLIEARGKRDFDTIMNTMKDLFVEYQTHVDEQLMKEVQAIDDCMYVFKRAIEEGTPIQHLMVLDKDKFYIDRKILLFPDPPPPPPVPLMEAQNPLSFTVEQLTTLVAKFTRMAPMGVIETPMIQTLADLAIAGHESGKPTIPSAWAKLDLFDYKEIFIEAFSDQTCLDWRNFIINISEVPYPTIEQLLDLKKSYAIFDPLQDWLITAKNYQVVPLWFEYEFGSTIEEDLKLSLAKTLIFKMFQINDQEMNYFDMLIGYCRAEDPEDGLGMALDLLMDSGYILKPETCLREDEYEKIHPRKIIDYILVNFFKDLLDITETIQLKYLPHLTNPEVFASEENEFEESEDILRQNMGQREDYGDISSTDSETNRPKQERELFLDDDDDILAKYCSPKWQMCIPYEIALALLMNALNYYALSPIHQHRILNIEQRLKELYKEKGTVTHIRAYRLTTSDLFKELYATTAIFKKTNISRMVENFTAKKRESATVVEVNFAN